MEISNLRCLDALKERMAKGLISFSETEKNDCYNFTFAYVPFNLKYFVANNDSQ